MFVKFGKFAITKVEILFPTQLKLIREGKLYISSEVNGVPTPDVLNPQLKVCKLMRS
jgi:hypothetical protein